MDDGLMDGQMGEIITQLPLQEPYLYINLGTSDPLMG